MGSYLASIYDHGSPIFEKFPKTGDESMGDIENMTILRAENLIKTYRIEDREIPVLRGVSLSVVPGEFLVIRGNSGSGKTTLLSLLSGLDSPTDGRVFLKDTEITEYDESRLAALRNRAFGFVFQAFHLVPSLSALENVSFPAELNHADNAMARAAALLDEVGLSHRADNFPHQLSGGEKQRVAICRALINQPELIFADEPTGNLDSESGRTVLELLQRIRSDRGATLVMVTHSADIARQADRILTLKDGRIIDEHRPVA